MRVIEYKAGYRITIERKRDSDWFVWENLEDPTLDDQWLPLNHGEEPSMELAELAAKSALLHTVMEEDSDRGQP